MDEELRRNIAVAIERESELTLYNLDWERKEVEEKGTGFVWFCGVTCVSV